MSATERPLIVPVHSPFLKQNPAVTNMSNVRLTSSSNSVHAQSKTVNSPEIVRRKSLEHLEPLNLESVATVQETVSQTVTSCVVVKTSSNHEVAVRRPLSKGSSPKRNNRLSREIIGMEDPVVSAIDSAPNHGNSVGSLSRKQDSEDDDASSILYGGSVASTIPDRYGFIGGSQYTFEKDSIPVAVLRRREMKWLQMIHEWQNYMKYKYKKVRDRCRKGIPSSVRPRAWLYLCGGIHLMEKNPGVFKELLAQPGNPKWIEDIRKDLHRQFPWHEMFAEPSGHGQEELFRVLKAYTVLNTTDGYSQGQAPVAAMLVMHMPAEQAFWCLVAICEKYVPGYYSEQMDAIQTDGDILFSLLKKVAPGVHRHMSKQKIDPVLYMVEWFLCIFTRTLPWPSVLRVWDMFFCEGVKVLFRVGLVLLKATFARSGLLKRCPTMVETIEVLRNIPSEVTEENFLVSQMLKLPITEEDLDKTHRKVLLKRNALNKEH